MTIKEKRFSVRETISDAFGLDFADVENDYRYQPGAMHTPCAVYSIGDRYYTATKSVATKPKTGCGYTNWKPVVFYQLNSEFQVWEHCFFDENGVDYN